MAPARLDHRRSQSFAARVACPHQLCGTYLIFDALHCTRYEQIDLKMPGYIA
jgi:hypothetical protein